MASNTVEALIGGVVLVAAGGFLVYAANTADISATSGGYELVAKFRKAEGLSAGADVRVGGVKVGSITSMELDPTSYKAIVTLSVDNEIKLPEDSDIKITSASLLSDNYLAIGPGASEFMLEPGDEFEFTQDSVNVMDLVFRFVQGGSE